MIKKLGLTLLVLAILGYCVCLGNEGMEPSLPHQGALGLLARRSDVTIYKYVKAKEFVGGKRRRCYACPNSNSVIVVTDTLKNAYPASFQVVIAGHTPSSGVYEFQEVDIDKLVAIGIDIELLLEVQFSAPSTGMGGDMGASQLLHVTVRPGMTREFEKKLRTVLSESPSEQARFSRIK